MSLIDEYLRLKQSKPKPRLSGVLYVTDLTKPCQLQAYLNIKEAQTFPVETLRIFEAGNMIEDYWDNILVKNSGIWVLGTQVPTYYFGDGWEVHGRLDALCQHDNGCIVAHEVKSIKSTYYLRGPRDEHLEQVQFYMNVLGVDSGQVDYLDKKSFLDGKGVIDHCFKVKRDSRVFGWMVERAMVLAAAVTGSGDVPVGSPLAWSGKICDYCGHRDKCGDASGVGL